MRTLGKDLTGESEEVSFGIAPSFARQPGLLAGFLEKLFLRQPVFDRHLGKQKATTRMMLDKKSVMPDFDSFRGDRFHS